MLPLLVGISILIEKENSGLIFYPGIRAGRFGKLFKKILKFRTMVANTDKIGSPSIADDDPRLLKIRKYLRKHKLEKSYN